MFGRIACIVPNDTGFIRNDFYYIVPNECDSNVRKVIRHKQRKGRRSFKNSGGLSSVLRRNRGQAAQIIVLVAVGDGFEVFRFASVGDADAGDLALFGHVHGLLFFDDGIVGKLIAGDPAALLDQGDDAFGVGVCLGDLVEGLLCEILSVHVRHSFGVVFAAVGRICVFTDWEKCGIIQTNERGEWPCRKAITSRAGSWKSATS